MKIFKIILLVTLSLTLSFCANDKKTNDLSNDIISEIDNVASINLDDEDLELVEIDSSASTETYPEPAVTAKFKNGKIGNAYKNYSKLQNALVNANVKEATTAATGLKTAMEAVGADELVLKAVSSVIASSDIEVQRAQFVAITAEMEKMLTSSLDTGMIYKMYCPMAFNNTGGYWLSSDKQIQNPYFGDKMMRCGRVDSAIQ